MADIKLTLVVACALVDTDKRVLIAQRPEGKALAGLWEFPGGKVEAGERPRDALIRECREELDVTLDVGGLYMQVTHEYPDIQIRLSLYEAVIASGELRGKEHEALCWILPREIPDYEFCPADVDIIHRIRREGRNHTNLRQSNRHKERNIVE